MIKLSYFLAVLLSLLLWSNGFTQKINYKKFRTTLPNYICGEATKKKCLDEYKIFLKLDSSKIKEEDLFLYYKDFGSACYGMSMISKTEEERKLYFRQSTYYYAKAIAIDNTDTQLLWDYAFELMALGQCSDAKKYLLLYLKYSPKKQSTEMQEQIAILKKGCNIQ